MLDRTGIHGVFPKESHGQQSEAVLWDCPKRIWVYQNTTFGTIIPLREDSLCYLSHQTGTNDSQLSTTLVCTLKDGAFRSTFPFGKRSIVIRIYRQVCKQ